MTPLSRIKLVCMAAAGALFALAVTGGPARAHPSLPNWAPVGPSEPILVTIGTQRVVAFYTPDRGLCAVNAVVWKDADPDAPYSSARVRISLKPGQMFQLDGGQRQSMSLVCGADAASLVVAAPPELILTGTSDSRK